MTNQQIIDCIEDSLPAGLPANVKEMILDRAFDILNDQLGIDLEVPDDQS